MTAEEKPTTPVAPKIATFKSFRFRFFLSIKIFSTEATMAVGTQHEEAARGGIARDVVPGARHVSRVAGGGHEQRARQQPAHQQGGHGAIARRVAPAGRQLPAPAGGQDGGPPPPAIGRALHQIPHQAVL